MDELNEIDVQIIRAMSECDMKVYAVADKLHYSRQAIGYHLGRIRRLTGLNPKGFFDFCRNCLKLLEVAMAELKIIDFERKGNVIRFYLGAADCTDYWGDDWDDAPYDCNAGTVYDKYISGVKDVAFPFDSLVLEPSSEWGGANRYFSKEDMKLRRVPCIIVVPAEVRGDSWLERFTDWIGCDGVKKIYFGDPVEVLDNG